MSYRSKNTNFRKKLSRHFFVENLIPYKKRYLHYFYKIISGWDIYKKIFYNKNYGPVYEDCDFWGQFEEINISYSEKLYQNVHENAFKFWGRFGEGLPQESG